MFRNKRDNEGCLSEIEGKAERVNPLSPSSCVMRLQSNKFSLKRPWLVLKDYQGQSPCQGNEEGGILKIKCDPKMPEKFLYC
jgi:hypothetical protein